ncbi:MAG: metal-dependent hydrolase [bacterium]|nr:metal-dependent hydrolase [bacterium]
MKGITHFMTGVAVSSFFGRAVEMAEYDRSWILILGGMYGIMADTLDFKFYAFFSRDDHEVSPDPLRPDARTVAAQIGKAIEQAYDENRMVKIKCHTIRVGADLWRQYVIKFDAEKGEVVVVMNPIVTTSQIPYVGTEPKEHRVGRYKLRVPLVETHGRPTVVDIMNGPQIGFKRTGDHVIVEFIPFHRTWTHSFFVGFLAAAVAALVASLGAGWGTGWYYGLVAMVAYWSHLASDLTGYMGASFFWPFWKKRTPGLGWFKAQNPHSNFIFNYFCLIVTIFNLNRFTYIDPVSRTGHYIAASPLKYFLWTFIIPIGAYLLLAKLFGRKEKEEKEGVVLAEQAMQEEAVDQMEGQFT